MRMKKPKYFLWIAAVEAGGILAGLLTREGVSVYNQTAVKPFFSPPGILFPIVWTVLYALMGISAARVAAAPSGSDRSWGLNLFVSQLIVNYFWSFLFFNAQAYGLALLWLLLLLVLILGMAGQFAQVDNVAAWLQIPYLLWVIFAALLNYGVYRLNP